MLSRRQAQLWNAVEVDAVEVVVSIFVVFIVVRRLLLREITRCNSVRCLLLPVERFLDLGGLAWGGLVRLGWRARGKESRSEIHGA